ncbi:MAG TPA: hypothetical protein VLA60_15525 [Nitrospirales bacterium]|nr:hypothetical protein [Nitrospirales bacterium]
MTRSMTRYNYNLQCWVVDHIIQRCTHPSQMFCRCRGREFHGLTEQEAVGVMTEALNTRAS